MIIKPNFEVIISPPGLNPDISKPKYRIILCNDISIACFGQPPLSLHRWFLRKLFGFKFIIYQYNIEIEEE